MERSLVSQVLADLERKIVLLGGPRQVGKTTLSRSVWSANQCYLNYDSAPDRKILAEQAWPKDVELIVLDEIHKMRSWKSWLKGVYDTQGVRPRILVTGSARLDTWKKGNDSLAGRHHYLRLHPLSVAELKKEMPHDEALNAILKFGGFPEPLFGQSETSASRWRRTHLDTILRQDLLDLEQIRNIRGIELLVELLAERVGSPVSFSSLARDLEVSPHTVKNWILVLERLFVIFAITPYSKNLARALLKEPKIYFYDTGRVSSEGGARLENAVACALLKRAHFLEDTRGERHALHYVRDKEKREVDFLTLNGKQIEHLIEVKSGDGAISQHMHYFAERLSPKHAIQLAQNLTRRTQHGLIRTESASQFLSTLES